MAESSSGRFRHPGWIAGGVVAVATAVMAVVAVLDHVRPPDARGTSETATSPPVVPGGPNPGQPGPTGAAAGTPVAIPLADLTPVRGARWLVPLPDELAGESGYERAVVVACSSNPIDDRHSEVTYEARYRYSTLDAELRPYRSPPDDVLVDLEIFSDPQDRDPGAPAPGDPHWEQLRMGELRAVDGVDIDEAYYLRLRVTCEKPGGYLILTAAVLHPLS